MRFLEEVDHLTLGSLRAALTEQPLDAAVFVNWWHPQGGVPLMFIPSGLDSWRGVYKYPSLVWQREAPDQPTFVADVIAWIDEALAGRHYEGYKGGEYIFVEDYPVWVDPYGEASNNLVTELRQVKPWTYQYGEVDPYSDDYQHHFVVLVVTEMVEL